MCVHWCVRAGSGAWGRVRCVTQALRCLRRPCADRSQWYAHPRSPPSCPHHVAHPAHSPGAHQLLPHHTRTPTRIWSRMPTMVTSPSSMPDTDGAAAAAAAPALALLAGAGAGAGGSGTANSSCTGTMTCETGILSQDVLVKGAGRSQGCMVRVSALVCGVVAQPARGWDSEGGGRSGCTGDSVGLPNLHLQPERPQPCGPQPRCSCVTMTSREGHKSPGCAFVGGFGGGQV